jgi:hypothetical protein
MQERRCWSSITSWRVECDDGVVSSSTTKPPITTDESLGSLRLHHARPKNDIPNIFVFRQESSISDVDKYRAVTVQPALEARYSEVLSSSLPRAFDFDFFDFPAVRQIIPKNNPDPLTETRHINSS